MKNQRMNCQRKFQPIKFIVLMAMLLVVTTFIGVVAVSGAEGPVPVIGNPAAIGLEYDSDAGCWVMTYGAESWTKNADNTITLDPEKAGISVEVEGKDDVAVTGVTIINPVATLGEAPNAFISISYEIGTVEQDPIPVPLRIEPKQLTWSGSATAEDQSYSMDGIEYSDVPVIMGDATLVGIFADDDVTVPTSIDPISFSAINVKDGTVYTKVAVTGADAGNYIIPLLPVQVSISPVSLGAIEWTNAGEHVYGADADGNGIYDYLEIVAKAPVLDKDGNPTAQYIDLPVFVRNTADGTFVPLAKAFADGIYGNVLAGAADGKTSYIVAAETPNDLYQFTAESNSTQNSNVTIAQRVYSVVLRGAEYLTQVDLSANTANTIFYQILVSSADGTTIPSELLAKVTYSYANEAGEVVSTNGVNEAGNYTVTATLPSLTDGAYENYAFQQESVSATLLIKRNHIFAGTADQPYQMIITGENGLNPDISATLTTPDSIDRDAIYGYHVYKAYTLQIQGGAADQSFRIILPIASIMAEDPNCNPLRVEDLYLYDAGTMTAASEKYTVTLSENGAYYIIEGYNTDAAVTFIVAPEYEVSFWVTAPGIAIIILIILLILLALFLAGLKLRQVEKRDEENETLVVDTEGEVPEETPAEETEAIEDTDAVLDESIDGLAEALSEEVTAEEEALDTEVDASEAVEEAMEDLNAELESIDLSEESTEEYSEVDELTETRVEELTEELLESVSAEEAEQDVSDEVNEAVAEAMAENFNESADASDAVVIPVVASVSDDDEDDDDNDNDEDDDDGDSYGAYGSMPLNFIDAIAEAEAYNEMLAQESRGEVQIITRYRRSYQSRLSQAQGSVPDYYNIIKNHLLSYKGVKNRISWNYETFNVGRTPVAKFNAKTRTLYVYMSLTPEELVDTKYTFVDVSSKKKYAAVPVLMKIKGDRKFKHAMEMITALCEEKLQLPKKKVYEEADYKIPYMTTEALVQEGLVKKLVAAIPLVDIPEEEPVAEEAPVTEEAPVEEIPVEEEIAVENPVDTETTEA